MQSKFTIGIFGIILNKQNKILLCHRRDYDLWNLPGGGLEKNESIQSGLIREVKEETGLAVKISRLAGVYSKPYKNEIVFFAFCVFSIKIAIINIIIRGRYVNLVSIERLQNKPLIR